MSVPIITGANFFRAKKTLSADEIRSLKTTGVLLCPAIPGKTINVAQVISAFTFGGEVWQIAATDFHITAIYYGNTLDDAAWSNDVVVQLINGSTESKSYNSDGFGSGGVFPAASTIGAALYLKGDGIANFDTGSALTASVDPAHKGLLYAVNDTGTIQVTGDATDPTYTVTGTGAGGLVTTVTVAGGTGVTVGGSFPTTVTTGSGDGNLKLSITAIRPIGNGTLEIDVLYQPT